MPTSGGTAAQVYAMLEREPDRRQWLANVAFTALASADAEEYARIVEAELSAQPTATGAPDE